MARPARAAGRRGLNAPALGPPRAALRDAPRRATGDTGDRRSALAAGVAPSVCRRGRCCSRPATRPTTAPPRRRRGAAAARGHGGQAAGPAADRVGRVHRPLRGRCSRSRSGRGCRATCRRSASRTARSSRPARSLFVIDPRPYEAARRPGQGADRDAAGAARRWPSSTRAAPAKLVEHLGDGPRHARPAQRRAARRPRPALAGSRGAAPPGRARSRLHPRSPHRSPGRISDRRVDVGNLVDDQTLLTTIVQLDPIYLVFDMSESDFLAYQRAVAARASCPRPATTRDHRRTRTSSTRRTGRTRAR